MLDHDTAAALRARHAALVAAAGPVRARDAARRLGVSEAELAAARVAGGAGAALRRDPERGLAPLLEALPAAGEMMALTRNAHCVSEVHGRYAPPGFVGGMAQVVGAIDLRLFLAHWAHAFAVEEDTRSGPRRSLQVFDAAGDAVHKVYATEATDPAAFAAIVEAFADPDPAPLAVAPPPAAAPDRPDAEIDVAALRAAWAALEHSHDFFGLLRRLGVSRAQALRLAGPDFARAVPAAAARTLLERAAAAETPLMIFVGNPGCVQIYSGPVRRIEVVGPWLNVLDPRFNLHLREDAIAGAWVVRKPSLRGDVHALELYDAAGFAFAQVFGLRPPGERERADWRALATGLAAEAAP
jgi:putative hemin transport protein